MCPSCLHPIATGAACLRCGLPPAEYIPLTPRQRLRLIGPLAAALAVGGLLVLVLWAAANEGWNIVHAYQGMVALVLLAIALVGVKIGISPTRDLLLGAALRRRLPLTRMTMHRTERPTRFTVQFGDLPAFQVSGRQFGQLREGVSYRVTYSPHTHLCWEIR